MNSRHRFRSRDSDGALREVELTADQAADLMSGRAIAYYPHDHRVRVEGDDVVHVESALPPEPPTAS